MRGIQMNKVNYFLVFISLFFVLTACNQDNPVESTSLSKDKENPSPSEPVKESKEKGHENEHQENEITPPQNLVLMIIDQTQEEPAPANHFYFSIMKVPDGYSLVKMTWQSKHVVTSTPQEALNYSNGVGFYIQGSIPLMGFYYDPSWKGEKGKVTFYFEHDTKEQLTWQKTITLK